MKIPKVLCLLNETGGKLSVSHRVYGEMTCLDLSATKKLMRNAGGLCISLLLVWLNSDGVV